MSRAALGAQSDSPPARIVLDNLAGSSGLDSLQGAQNRGLVNILVPASFVPSILRLLSASATLNPRTPPQPTPDSPSLSGSARDGRGLRPTPPGLRRSTTPPFAEQDLGRAPSAKIRPTGTGPSPSSPLAKTPKFERLLRLLICVLKLNLAISSHPRQPWLTPPLDLIAKQISLLRILADSAVVVRSLETLHYLWRFLSTSLSRQDSALHALVSPHALPPSDTRPGDLSWRRYQQQIAVWRSIFLSIRTSLDLANLLYRARIIRLPQRIHTYRALQKWLMVSWLVVALFDLSDHIVDMYLIYKNCAMMGQQLSWAKGCLEGEKQIMLEEWSQHARYWAEASVSSNKKLAELFGVLMQLYELQYPADQSGSMPFPLFRNLWGFVLICLELYSPSLPLLVKGAAIPTNA